MKRYYDPFWMGVVVGAVVVWASMIIPAIALAADAPPSETTIPISTGAGGLGVGALGMWWSMHGRLKAAEKALEGIGPALPALVQRVETLVANLETLSKAMHEDGVTARGKIHDIRGILAKHDGRLIRLEERFNGLRDAVANGETSVPRPITDEPTGPVADTGRHRSVRDR